MPANRDNSCFDSADGRLADQSQVKQAAIVLKIRNELGEANQAQDPAYREAVLTALDAAADACLDYIDGRTSSSRVHIPEAVVTHAQLAARSGVGLGAMLASYMLVHRALADTMTDEAHSRLTSQDALVVDLLLQNRFLEQLTTIVSTAYEDEHRRIAKAFDEKNKITVHKLLAGEHVDPSCIPELRYDIHLSWHIGLITIGPGGREILSMIDAHFGGRMLTVADGDAIWGWAGAQNRRCVAEVERILQRRNSGVSLALGEPAKGLEGWRLTHEQAEEAMELALQKPERFARYADDRLLAAALRDSTLAKSLRQRYLVPLSSQRDGGATLRETLRTYIDVECNASSAVHVLKVGRHAITRRVRTAERLIGCALRECMSELDVALRLDALERPAWSDARHD